MTYSLDPKVRFRAIFGPKRYHTGPDVGKWVFRVGMNQFPDALKTLSEAVAAGELGPILYGNDRIVELNHGQNVICVFSQTSDLDSVTEVLQVLRRIGFEQDMDYKTDEVTEMGVRLGIGLNHHKWIARDDQITAG